MQPLILASTSTYRHELLNRLYLPFLTQAPNCDESAHRGETAKALVLRLSKEKVESVKDLHPGAIIIGSDQVAEMDGEIIGKPDSHMAAVQQLSYLSGRSVTFNTGLSVYNTATGSIQSDNINTHVKFRVLNRKQIEAYLSVEQPYDCCASFKSEGLGITLVRQIDSRDPTALIGLPLIRLTEMLAQIDIELPAKSSQ